jgi:HK97 gp10 family phage protein
VAKKVEFKIEGIKEAIKAFNELPVTIEKKILKSTILKVARALQSAVVRRAPVGFTGKLAESIKTSTQGLKGKLAINVVVKPFYSRFLEFGTSKMSAKPFMRPAFDESLPQMEAAFAEALTSGVKREVKKASKKK